VIEQDGKERKAHPHRGAGHFKLRILERNERVEPSAQTGLDFGEIEIHCKFKAFDRIL